MLAVTARRIDDQRMRDLLTTCGLLVGLVACGPSESLEPEPDAMEVDASLDNAIVEGQWAIHLEWMVEGCQAQEWDVPMFDIEVESDGDVVATCADCTTIAAQVLSLETMHVDVTKQLINESIVSLDCSDDGMTAACAGSLLIATTACDTSELTSTVTRVRE